MEKYDYNAAKANMSYFQELMGKYNALVACGIPKNKVHEFDSPLVLSGYSMGQVVEVWCNSLLILKEDSRNDYAKSCGWKAKHGFILIRFNKATLKKYIDLCCQIRESNYDSRLELVKQLNELVQSSIDVKSSVIKKKYQPK